MAQETCGEPEQNIHNRHVLYSYCRCHPGHWVGEYPRSCSRTLRPGCSPFTYCPPYSLAPWITGASQGDAAPARCSHGALADRATDPPASKSDGCRACSLPDRPSVSLQRMVLLPSTFVRAPLRLLGPGRRLPPRLSCPPQRAGGTGAASGRAPRDRPRAQRGGINDRDALRV